MRSNSPVVASSWPKNAMKSPTYTRYSLRAARWEEACTQASSDCSPVCSEGRALLRLLHADAAIGRMVAGRAHLLFVGHAAPGDPPGEYGGVDGAPLPYSCGGAIERGVVDARLTVKLGVPVCGGIES